MGCDRTSCGDKGTLLSVPLVPYGSYRLWVTGTVGSKIEELILLFGLSLKSFHCNCKSLQVRDIYHAGQHRARKSRKLAGEGGC